MKRNVFGAVIVAGGLVLATSVAGFASKTQGDFNAAADAAKTAVSECANHPALTDPAGLGLTGAKATEAAALKAEAVAGIAELVAEANSSIDEAVAEIADEDGAKDTSGLNAQLTRIVTSACKEIASLKAEYETALKELQAESTTPEVDKQDVEKQDVEKPEKPDVEKPEKPEVRSTTSEGND